MELFEILWVILVSFWHFLYQLLFGTQRRRSSDRSGVPFRKSRTRSIENQNGLHSELLAAQIRTTGRKSKSKLRKSTSEKSTFNRPRRSKKKINSQNSLKIKKSLRSRKQRSKSKAPLPITLTKPKTSEEPDVFDAIEESHDMNESAQMDQPKKSARQRYSKSDNSFKKRDVSSSKNLSENDIRKNLSEENEESKEIKEIKELLKVVIPSIDSQKKSKTKSKSKSKSRSKKKHSKLNNKNSRRKESSDVFRKESIEIITDKTQNDTDNAKEVSEPEKSYKDSQMKSKSKSKSKTKRRKSKSKNKHSKRETDNERSRKSSSSFQGESSHNDIDNVLEKAMKALNSGRGRKGKSSIRSSMKKSQSTPQFTQKDEISDKSSKSKRGGGVSFREQLNVKLIPVDNKGKKVKRKNKETPSLLEIMDSNKAAVIDETWSGERYGRSESSRSKKKRRNRKKSHRRKKEETPPGDEIVLD